MIVGRKTAIISKAWVKMYGITALSGGKMKDKAIMMFDHIRLSVDIDP